MMIAVPFLNEDELSWKLQCNLLKINSRVLKPPHAQGRMAHHRGRWRTARVDGADTVHRNSVKKGNIYESNR